MEDEILKYLKNRNINVSTKNKARGHLGFFCNDKIAISKEVPKEKRAQVLLHEFAHKIHSEIEPDKFKTGGSLDIIFNCTVTDEMKNELLNITNFVDKNSKCEQLENIRNEYKQKVQYYEKEIKKEFPDFAKSKKFAEYDKYQRKTKSKTKYFLKYDHVKISMPWFFKNEFYSIEKIDEDFPELPQNFKNYFYLLSNYRKQKKVQNKIAKLKRYYAKPTELFARFVECLVKDEQIAKTIAPNTYERFTHLASCGYYNDLPHLLELAQRTNHGY